MWHPNQNMSKATQALMWCLGLQPGLCDTLMTLWLTGIFHLDCVAWSETTPTLYIPLLGQPGLFSSSWNEGNLLMSCPHHLSNKDLCPQQWLTMCSCWDVRTKQSKVSKARTSSSLKILTCSLTLTSNSYTFILLNRPGLNLFEFLPVLC